MLRVPDTAHVFSTGYYADCFLRLVKAQHFRQDQLHHVYEEAGHLLEDLQREAGQVRYLVERGPFDSNPCRVHNACFLNPLYELLPRDDWIVSNGVCQEQADPVPRQLLPEHGQSVRARGCCGRLQGDTKCQQKARVEQWRAQTTTAHMGPLISLRIRTGIRTDVVSTLQR